jgi:hypothetical protein
VCSTIESYHLFGPTGGIDTVRRTATASNINTRTRRDGFTTLHVCAFLDAPVATVRVEMAELLIERKATITTMSECKDSPLDLAVFNDLLPMV